MTLREWLNSTGTTQEALAKALGVGRPTVCHLANGDKTPSLRLALSIDKATKGRVPVSGWRPMARRP